MVDAASIRRNCEESYNYAEAHIKRLRAEHPGLKLDRDTEQLHTAAVGLKLAAVAVKVFFPNSRLTKLISLL
jgi:hypothetical protein